MHPNPTVLQKKRGSALLTVVMLTAMMAILTASMLSYTLGEKRGNERNRMQLRAKNMAENISIYAAEQLTTKLYRTRATSAMAFMTGSNEIHLPDSSGTSSVLSNVSFATLSGMEVRAGLESPTAYTLVTDPTSTNYGLQVSTATVPIIAKATVTHPALGSMTSHVLQEMEIAMTPLFQFGMFYNMDLELFPGQAMTIMGPVHTNGRLIARGEVGGSAILTFSDRVSAAKGLYADGQLKVAYRNRSGGNTAGAGGSGAVYYTAAVSGTQTNLSNGIIWRDHKYGLTTESATTLNNFKTFTTSTYGTNVRTNVHGVTTLELPGIGTYNETNLTTTPEDDRNNGRQIIEPPDPNKYNGTSWAATTDDADSRESKISWKAGLYIAVNPDDTVRSAKLPDGTTVYITPQSYRCWLNSIDTSNVHTCTEVVLPGQPSYGYHNGVDGTAGTADDYMYRNNLPNAYTTGTAVGSNQVLRIPEQPYGNGSGYVISNIGGYPVTTSSLTVTGGTGTILPGDTLTIIRSGVPEKYTVHQALAGGIVEIAAPGLRTAIADGTPIYVDGTASFSGMGTGYLINSSSTLAVATTSLPVDTGTGSILAGNTLAIGAHKYLVTGALSNGFVTIASPGLRATVADNTPVTVDPLSGTRGNGNNYLLNGALAANATSITVDTGAGTILPGNTVLINGYPYTVASALTANVFTISPGLYVAAADNTFVRLDLDVSTGYKHNTGTGTGYLINNGAGFPIGAKALMVDTGTGSINVGDIVTIGVHQYTVHSALDAGTGIFSIASPGLLAAIGDNAPVTLEALSGPVFPLETDTSAYPSDAYFYDSRRANGNAGFTSNVSGGTARASNNYLPRPIAKIDFDMARFKMMVSRSVYLDTTANGYLVQAPNAGNWTNNIYNSGGTPTTIDLGLDDAAAGGLAYTLLPPASGGSLEERTRQDPFRMYFAPANPASAATIAAIYDDPRAYVVPAADIYDGTTPDAWFDGVAVFINSVDAEMRAQSSGVPRRVDSGVRFINGRGPVVSLTATGKTGCTLVTNDAAYIVGHFNADGTVNATVSSTGNGGYSGRYPDSANEKLVAVMADAITLLSQPVFSNASAPYFQTNGWNDGVSAFRITSSTWANTWRSAPPSTTNNYEGLGTSATAIRPGAMPFSTLTLSPNAPTRQTKLPPVDTEYSVALLLGIVPSNHDASTLTDGAPISLGNRQYSGGAHNFPRLIEDWHCDMGSGVNAKLLIRGSMVALFESRVAMEPWNIRTYAAPDRFWGLHENFRTAGHDIPLEPIVIGCSRKRYLEMTGAEYATKKAEIEALPH